MAGDRTMSLGDIQYQSVTQSNRTFCCQSVRRQTHWLLALRTHYIILNKKAVKC